MSSILFFYSLLTLANKDGQFALSVGEYVAKMKIGPSDYVIITKVLGI